MAEPGPKQHLHRQAKQGIRVLMMRQGLVMILTLGGGIVLARVLTPTDFGVFGITTFIVNALALISNGGLTPSFIQRREELTERDLQVGFTLQQGVVTVVVIGLWVLAPFLTFLYPKAPEELVWLVRVLGLGLFLRSWSAMSALQLERKLYYKPLAVIHIIDAVVYEIVAVTMAVLGFGVWSLVVAVMTRSLLGTVLTYRLAPFRPRLAFDARIAREVVRFGLPFLGQRVLANAKGWVTPLLVGSLIGPEAVGFLTWASSLGGKPLRLVDSVVRVSFSHFARFQDDLPEVVRVLRKYFSYLIPVCLLWFAVILTAGRDLAAWIYTPKWLPAVPALYLYALLLSLTVLTWITGITLQSLGHVGYTMRVAATRTAIHLAGSVALVTQIGFVGIPLSEIVCLVLTTPLLYRKLGPGVLTSLLRSLGWTLWPFLGSVAAGALSRLLALPVMAQGVATALVAAGTYAALAWLLGPEDLRVQVAGQLQALRRRLRPAGVVT